jgi:hypothetical protein
VRLVDTNASNIAAAASWGIPTTLGDATDNRWLEQEVANSQTGWVIAMTDNVDVDRVVARWAAKRFGAGKSLQWFRSEPEEGPVKAFAQWGRPLRHLLFQMDMELARVEAWEDDGPEGAVPLAVIDAKGDLHLDSPEGLEEPAEGSTTIGIVFGAPPKPSARKSDATPPDPKSEQKADQHADAGDRTQREAPDSPDADRKTS